MRRQPKSTLFPYTTLFRSWRSLSINKIVTGPAVTARRESALLGCGSTAAGDELLPSKALRSEEHTSELQSLRQLVCRLLLEKKKIEKKHDAADQDRDRPTM